MHFCCVGRGLFSEHKVGDIHLNLVVVLDVHFAFSGMSSLSKCCFMIDHGVV